MPITGSPGLLHFGKALTFADVDRLSRQFAAYLLGELQLKKGDRVAIMLPNCLQYPVAIFGVLRAGLTVVNVNPMYTARELRHQLEDSGAKAILVLDNFGDTVQEGCWAPAGVRAITSGLGDMLGFPKGSIVNFVLKYVKKMVPDYRIEGAVRFRDALTLGQMHPLPEVAIGHDDIAFLQYTGGTTGVAKGAMLTHAQHDRQHAAGRRRGWRRSTAGTRSRSRRCCRCTTSFRSRPRDGVHAHRRTRRAGHQPARHARVRQDPEVGAVLRSCPASTPCSTACSTPGVRAAGFLAPEGHPRRRHGGAARGGGKWKQVTGCTSPKPTA